MRCRDAKTAGKQIFRFFSSRKSSSRGIHSSLSSFDVEAAGVGDESNGERRRESRLG